MNKTITIAISLTLLGGLSASADVLTPEQAWQRAATSSQAKAKGMSKSEQTPKLLYTEITSMEPAAYVFGTGQDGYVILSADDAALPVLGYSDMGAFDPDNIPDGLKYWLGFYGREIAYARDKGIRSQAPEYAPAKTEILPLLKTKWDQGAPYNSMCPKVGDKRCYTGCVATATAQVMNYHQWPEKPSGKVTYTTDGINVTVDYDKVTFDWANMLNQYTAASGTPAERNAVAELMFCVGAGLGMHYGTSASGIPSENIPEALIKYFDYDKNVHELYRDFYGKDEWEDMIYDNLVNYGPVIYSGSDADGSGHCFVCDGYRDGYFHINWGWSGSSDGYYLLSSLNPTSQGIGGAVDASIGFVIAQDAVFGMCKPKADSEYFYGLYFSQGYKLPASGSLGGTITVSGYLFSCSNAAFSGGTAGLEFLGSDGKSVYARGISLAGLKPWYNCNNYTVELPTSSQLPNGKYKVRPMWVGSDYSRHYIYNKYNYVQTYTATVNGTRVSFEADEIGSPSITIGNIDIKRGTYPGSRLVADVNVTNNGALEYFGTIQAGLFEVGAKEGTKPLYAGQKLMIDINGGETETIEYSTVFTNSKVGTYMLRFYEVNGNKYSWIGEGKEITLTEAPKTVIKAENFCITGGYDWAVKGEDVRFEFDVTCESGMYDGYLFIALSKGTESYWRKTFPTPHIVLEGGATGHYYLDVPLPSTFAVGNEAHAYLTDNATKSKANILAPVYDFKIVAEPSGIADVTGDAEVLSVTLYNLQGIAVPADTDVRGHYIRVTRYSDGTTKSEHIIK